MASLGEAFAEALSRKDLDGVLDLVDENVDFRALTPNRYWEASTSADLVSDVLRVWLEEQDVIEAVEGIETATVGDREHVAYRFRGHNDSGSFVVEQQAYYTASGGRIDWLRVLCSGLRPPGD